MADFTTETNTANNPEDWFSNPTAPNYTYDENNGIISLNFSPAYLAARGLVTNDLK